MIGMQSVLRVRNRVKDEATGGFGAMDMNDTF